MQFCERTRKRCVSLQYVQVIRRRRHICHLVKEKKIKGGGTKKDVLGSPVFQQKWWTRVVPGIQTRTLQDMDHFTGWHGKRFKFYTFLSDQDLSNHTKWTVPRQAPQAWYLLPQSSLQKLGVHFKSQWKPRLQWRYVHDWAISDITCWVGIVSYRHVVIISLSCRLQGASSNLKQNVTSFRKLILSTSYRHRTWNNVHSDSYRTIRASNVPNPLN
jgi:hypothetical protein